MVEDKKKTVECVCDHLTNFAILMQIKEFKVCFTDIPVTFIRLFFCVLTIEDYIFV